jgi:hypothetical protein
MTHLDMPEITEDITIEGLTVRNSKVSKAFVFDIPTIIEWNNQTTKQDFWNIVVYEIPGGLFLLQYNNQEDRDNDANLFKKLFQRDGFFSKKWANGYQIPENAGEFEYKDHFYIILNTYNSLVSGSDSISIHGVIIGISSYEQVVSVKDSVSEIIQ